MPLTVVILIVLFAVQSRGTARVAAFFGPITVVWFIAIAVAGVAHIADNPAVLLALQSDLRRRAFSLSHGVIGLITLGAVFLAVTGAEALYADLGHFGRKPIQIAWLALVLPSLALNYLGQGALVLADPKAIENPFFLMYPDWALLPMVVLATAATVIASQAVITGAYSLTQQAIQLGLLPRLEIRHTSGEHDGQIYMPRVNTLLLIGVLLLVLLFRSSSALASAYGIAVTGTMVVTGIMAFVVIWKVWHWSPLAAAALMLPFLLIDLTFLGANLLKVVEGGWVPLALGGVLMVMMYTWRRGSRLLFEKTRRQETPLDRPGAHAREASRRRACPAPPSSSPATRRARRPRCCTASSTTRCCTRRTSSSRSRRRDTPRVDPAERVRIEPVGETFSRVALRFGFMEIAERAEGAGDRPQATAGTSTSCRRRSSCRGACSSRRRVPACRAGRTGCSSCSPAPPTTPPTISRFRPAGWSRSARR